MGGIIVPPNTIYPERKRMKKEVTWERAKILNGYPKIELEVANTNTDDYIYAFTESKVQKFI